jgi:hypothetical protein
MPGPPPTPAKLLLLRGNSGHRPKHRLSGPEPERPQECPELPPHLSGYAADEWWRVASPRYAAEDRALAGRHLFGYQSEFEQGSNWAGRRDIVVASLQPSRDFGIFRQRDSYQSVSSRSKAIS